VVLGEAPARTGAHRLGRPGDLRRFPGAFAPRAVQR
jgi:hypothetical protein